MMNDDDQIVTTNSDDDGDDVESPEDDPEDGPSLPIDAFTYYVRDYVGEVSIGIIAEIYNIIRLNYRLLFLTHRSFSERELPVPVLLWAKTITHPAARSLCDS